MIGNNNAIIRLATFILFINKKKILIDPMFSDVSELNSIPLTKYKKRNPLIPLPIEKNILIRDVDATIFTHNHFDHFDIVAEKILPKNNLIFYQPGHDKKLKEKGFINIRLINNSIEWETISIKRYFVIMLKDYLNI